MSGRYAIYFVPHPESLLWRLGCLWHGRDPASHESLAPPLPDGLGTSRWEEITRSASHYGFHATLKPPFVLAEGAGADALSAEINLFASRRRAFVAPALRVSRLGGFLALTLNGPSPDMDLLCADCVSELDSYRAPPPVEELAKRRKHGLTPRQEELLTRWGYPYVMDEFRFHMTLTMRLAEPEISMLEAHLNRSFRQVLAVPLYVERIALFHQPSREMPFRLVQSFPFGR